VWEPPADVFETPDAIWIVVALPGVSGDQIELRVEGPQLVVRGARSLPDSLQSASIRRMEIPSGRFERRFEVPLHHFDSIQQQLADGCLFLRLRKPSGGGRTS
jgi:HSP20 family molecular chaperone IbpA